MTTITFKTKNSEIERLSAILEAYGVEDLQIDFDDHFTLSSEQKKILDEQKHLTDSDYQASDEFLTELKREYEL